MATSTDPWLVRVAHASLATFAILVGASASSASSGLQQPADQGPLHIEVSEIWSTYADGPQGPLVSVTGMAEGTDGRIWIADARADRIIVVEADGTNPRLLARRGQGPGEVDGPHAIYRRADGMMAVLAVGSRSVEIFRSDGSFEQRVFPRLGVTNPKGFVLLPDGTIVISGGVFGSTHGIHHFDATGSPLNSWDEIPETTDWRIAPMIAGGPLALLSNGSLLFSRAAPHELIVYEASADGSFGAGRPVASDPNLVKPIGDDFAQESINEDGVKITQFKWMFPQSVAIFELDNGWIINIIRGIGETPRTHWQLYSGLDGELLAEATIDEFYSVWGQAMNGDHLVSYVHPETFEVMAARLNVTIRGK